MVLPIGFAFPLLSCKQDCLHDGGAMANVNVTIRLDEDLKSQADELFDELGMSFTTAINIFVKQALRERRIPFEATAQPSVHYAAVEVPQE